jgi:hypothetical protein
LEGGIVEFVRFFELLQISVWERDKRVEGFAVAASRLLTFVPAWRKTVGDWKKTVAA